MNLKIWRPVALPLSPLSLSLYRSPLPWTHRGLNPILLSSIIFCLDLNTSNLISTTLYVLPNLIDAKNLEFRFLLVKGIEHILLQVSHCFVVKDPVVLLLPPECMTTS